MTGSPSVFPVADHSLAPRAVSIVGPASPAKTAFIGALARELEAGGLKVAVLSWEIAAPLPDETKDTGRYRRAGASLAALASPGWLLLTYRFPDFISRPGLGQILPLLAPFADGVLVDGAADGLPRIFLGPASGPDSPEAEVWAVVEDVSGHRPVPAEAVAKVAALLRARWGAS